MTFSSRTALSIPVHDLYWGSGRAIWNNDHDTAYLYNSQGELVDEFSW
ncbi:hypothetical protein [Thermococcus profundus]|nr:hypothetical protein [Thermococcus profundus]